MRGFLRVLMLGLVLVLVALVSAFTAMRFAIHGREVQVPKLVGLTPAEATQTLNAQGLQLIVESNFYSSEIAEGRIVSQSPQPGTRVRRGWRVRVAESLGPQRAIIPDVHGQSGRAAEINLKRRGLDVATIAVAEVPGLPSDQVLAQSPPPNAEGVASPKVSVLVNAPEQSQAYVMPDLVGRQLSFVLPEIEAAGLLLVEMKKPMDPNAVIVKQSPSPGERINRGSAVRLEVAQ